MFNYFNPFSLSVYFHLLTVLSVLCTFIYINALFSIEHLFQMSVRVYSIMQILIKSVRWSDRRNAVKSMRYAGLESHYFCHCMIYVVFLLH